MIRQSVLAAAVAGAVVLGAAWSAQGATSASLGAPARATALTQHVPRIRLAGTALATAARRCAAWAADAGFPNDGYLAGSLTTSVAIALAESGCNQAACFDNTTKKYCAPPSSPGDSVDRGAWQLNSKVKGATTNQCAFNGPCSARAAYLTESDAGTFFDACVTYQVNAFTRFIPAAQDAVSTLRFAAPPCVPAQACA